MGNVLINEATLSSIADAIREKNGSTETYKPAEMVEAIEAITTGGDDEILYHYYTSALNNEEAQNILEDALTHKKKSTPAYVFAGQEKITEINIPVGFTSIGNYSFFGMSALDKITIPEGVEYIGFRAFCNVRQITNDIIIPASVRSISEDAFDVGTQNGGYYVDVYFKGTPTGTIDRSAFGYINHAISDIYVPWSEGEVANAPWGALSATIHYNYTE